jgi:Flp pilus assembly protein TadG
MFLLTMLLATHVAVGLWARSVVTSAAQDGARRLATYDQIDASNSSAVDARIRRQLGSLGSRSDTKIEFRQSATSVEVRVTANLPSILPANMLENANTIRVTEAVARVGQ